MNIKSYQRNDNSVLLTTDQLKDYLQCGRDNARRIAENANACVRIGNSVRWNRKKIDDYVSTIVDVSTEVKEENEGKKKRTYFNAKKLYGHLIQEAGEMSVKGLMEVVPGIGYSTVYQMGKIGYVGEHNAFYLRKHEWFEECICSEEESKANLIGSATQYLKEYRESLHPESEEQVQKDESLQEGERKIDLNFPEPITVEGQEAVMKLYKIRIYAETLAKEIYNFGYAHPEGAKKLSEFDAGRSEIIWGVLDILKEAQQ